MVCPWFPLISVTSVPTYSPCVPPCRLAATTRWQQSSILLRAFNVVRAMEASRAKRTQTQSEQQPSGVPPGQQPGAQRSVSTPGKGAGAGAGGGWGSSHWWPARLTRDFNSERLWGRETEQTPTAQQAVPQGWRTRGAPAPGVGSGWGAREGVGCPLTQKRLKGGRGPGSLGPQGLVSGEQGWVYPGWGGGWEVECEEAVMFAACRACLGPGSQLRPPQQRLVLQALAVADLPEALGRWLCASTCRGWPSRPRSPCPVPDQVKLGWEEREGFGSDKGSSGRVRGASKPVKGRGAGGWRGREGGGRGGG